MMEDDIRIEFDRIEKETVLAFLFIIDGDKVWLPKSEVRIYYNTKVMYIPEWLAEDKGLT